MSSVSLFRHRCCFKVEVVVFILSPFVSSTFLFYRQKAGRERKGVKKGKEKEGKGRDDIILK